MDFFNLKAYYLIFVINKLKIKEIISQLSIILVKIFFITLDKQRLDSIFNDQVMDLLILSSTLIFRNTCKIFYTSISTLADKYYTMNFIE